MTTKAQDIRTDREGYVYMGSLLIGKVSKQRGKGWLAYVQTPGSLSMRLLRYCLTKREAVAEVTIMREV